MRLIDYKYTNKQSKLKNLLIQVIYKTLDWCLFVYVYFRNRRKNYSANQDKIFTTYSLRPKDVSGQKKKFEKKLKGAQGDFFC